MDAIKWMTLMGHRSAAIEPNEAMNSKTAHTANKRKQRGEIVTKHDHEKACAVRPETVE